MRMIRTTTIAILALGLLAGSAVGVAAQDEEQTEVTSFTGVFRPGGEELQVDWTETVLPNGFTQARPGFAWKDRLESSDPRIAGEHTVIANWVIDPNEFDPWSRGEQANLLLSTSHRLSNDEGSWLGEGRGMHSTELAIAMEAIVFDGQDGYAGLTAFVIVDSTQEPATVSGVVYPAEMPEFPDPYVAE